MPPSGCNVTAQNADSMRRGESGLAVRKSRKMADAAAVEIHESSAQVYEDGTSNVL
jgi:hypothetical protein